MSTESLPRRIGKYELRQKLGQGGMGTVYRALEIGLKHELAVYDSVYIALAEQLGHPLITDDSRQATAASAEGITLKAITDFKQ